ncbi:MAG: diguanylate cyclase, partial [Sphingobium sp.]
MSGRAAANMQRSLFILSPGDRDGLGRAAQTAGWRSFAARRPVDAAQRIHGSDALVARGDLRGGDEAARLQPRVPAGEASGGA